MTTFQTSIDIGNRALQHCGARRIVTLADDSIEATAAVAFCYDKLREAELRRNASGPSPSARPRCGPWTRTRPSSPLSPSTSPRTTARARSSATWATPGESTTGSNVGNVPGADGSPWELYSGPISIRKFVLGSGPTASDVAYYSGELVRGDGGADTTTVYRSLQSSNSDVPPSAKWLSLGTASATLTFLYPVGAGPSNNSDTRNVYLLPANFLREAPQDPKAGNISYLGAPSGSQPDDWTFENGMIVSATTSLIVFRFAASVIRVPSFDPMFCEGLAARIGVEICEEVTQSTGKLQTIGSAYNHFMSEARQVNGIEQGPVQAPEDDYIVCRF